MTLRVTWLSLLLISASLYAQQLPRPSGQTGTRPASAQPAQAQPAKATPPAPASATKSAVPAAQPAAVQASEPAKAPADMPPTVLKNVVFRPTFLTADISHFSGLAFRVRSEVNGKHFLVGAHSLFGPAAELQEQLTPEQISQVIVAAVGVSINDPSYLVLAKNYVYVPEAHAADDKGSERDIAAFVVTNPTQEAALTMDPAKPLVGDRVWLYVKYAGSTRVGLESATIVWLSDKELRYHFDHQDANLIGTMGAPLLSPDGTVVGMHIGTFKGKSGTVFGYACPGADIRKVIDGGAPAPQKPKKSLLPPPAQ